MSGPTVDAINAIEARLCQALPDEAQAIGVLAEAARRWDASGAGESIESVRASLIKKINRLATKDELPAGRKTNEQDGSAG